MPTYDFRCKACSNEFAQFYKTTGQYAEATPVCPACGAADLARIIRKVTFGAPSRDYSRLSANEMLNVFSSGDSKQVGQMFDQVTGTNPALAVDYHDTTQRLLRGESMDKVERSLQERDSERKKPGESPAKNSEA